MIDHVNCKCILPSLETIEEKTECTCDRCVGACEQIPGWFAPGEAEKAAEYLGMNFEIFQALLIKDHCSDPMAQDAPYVWSPRKIGVDGSETIRGFGAQRTKGRCVFLKEKRCLIHTAKPYECKKVFACSFEVGTRDEIETMYLKAGAPLGMRPE